MIPLPCASRRSPGTTRHASARSENAAWQDDFTRLPYTPEVSRMPLWQSPAPAGLHASGATDLLLTPPPPENLFRLDLMDDLGGFSLTLWADTGGGTILSPTS